MQMLQVRLCRYVQNTNLNSTQEECARLNAKLEILEQRQGAAAHQISDAVHTQSVHAKQVDRCMEEHQHRLMMSINKAESRGREAAEQIAQQAVSDAQTSMQVLHFAARACIMLYKRLSLPTGCLVQSFRDSYKLQVTFTCPVGPTHNVCFLLPMFHSYCMRPLHCLPQMHSPNRAADLSS